ncbi:MAG: Gfo/Idh/MocA family oxidoreductase [Thermoguttaceae bacterium]
MAHGGNAGTRREFLEGAGRIATASALAGTSIPAVHAAEQNTIRLALIGSGSRGGGATIDALSVANGPIELVAMADVFQERLEGTYHRVAAAIRKEGCSGTINVPKDRQFVGFDAYRKAMDCLKPGDVAILAAPPAFRWPHYQYAIEKGLHVFIEKPLAVDGPTARRMLALGREASKKNLKTGVGLVIRHCRARQALHERIRDGQIGDIVALRTYRMQSLVAGYIGRNETGLSELLYQVQRFHAFLWASGGAFSDYYIHTIDECCWMKDALPVEAQANGGRHSRGEMIDQNFDHYSVEYTFADGAKLFAFGRCMPGCYQEFSSYAHGTKGLGVITTSGHLAGRCRTYRGQAVAKRNLLWQFPKAEENPYRLEWWDLIEAIRQDKPYNEVECGVNASIVASMGRMAAHTGRVVTFDAMLNCQHEFAPDVDKLTMTSPAPLQAGPDGRYPVPQPGIVTDREY